MNGVSTITVNNGGTLRLAGIIVTHVPGNGGLGVIVNSGGELVLSDGVISGNAVGSSSGGCGVCIYGGSFVMDGGVFVSSGFFELLGGVISDNVALGGGVYTRSPFVMSGGVISDNTAAAITGSSHGSGGGVSIDGVGSFVLSGGRISGNAATGNGGGVWVTDAAVNP